MLSVLSDVCSQPSHKTRIAASPHLQAWLRPEDALVRGQECSIGNGWKGYQKAGALVPEPAYP